MLLFWVISPITRLRSGMIYVDSLPPPLTLPPPAPRLPREHCAENNLRYLQKQMSPSVQNPRLKAG